MTVLCIQTIFAATKRVMTGMENTWKQMEVFHLLFPMTCLVLGMHDTLSLETGSFSSFMGTRTVLQTTLLAAVTQQVVGTSMTSSQPALQQRLLGPSLQLVACGALLLVLAGVETNPGPFPPMFAAIGRNDLARVRRLLEQDQGLVNQPYQGFSPLHYAVQENHEGMVSLLVDHRADIEATTSLGNTALNMAASEGQVSMASLLLEHGARVDTTNHQGFSPLLSAADYGHTAMVNLLVSHGGRLDEREADTQDTPLIKACFGGHLSTVTALLAHGAGLDLQQHAGMTALHVAAQEGHQACVEVLLQGGADYSIPQRIRGPTHTQGCTVEQDWCGEDGARPRVQHRYGELLRHWDRATWNR